ncbi:ABC transporter ATP-binding protein [bacterium]|nr:ABC transporter ATP-binding protein [bacterium]
MFQIVDIKKCFNELVAVNSVSLHLGKGEIYGLLGPNGAGKSTIVNIITGLLSSDSGTILFQNTDCTHCPRDFKRKMGVAPQEIALYEDLSAIDNLKFWGSIHGVPSRNLTAICMQTAQQVGLKDRVKDKVKTFSGGMKRRLNLAVAIMHKPDLLLLDEPTAGVDPQSRHHILEIVKNLAHEGTSVLYTTHYLEEAETICDRIGIIDNGSVVAEGTLAQLCDFVQVGRIACLEGHFHASEATKILQDFPGLSIASAESKRIVVKIDTDDNLIHFMKAIFEKQMDIHSVSVKPQSLETAFLLLTGKELRD